MPRAPHAFKRLSGLYRGVLQNMHLIEWVAQGGRRPGADRPVPGPVTFDALEPRLLLSAAVTTDKPDYHPGETAVIGASGIRIEAAPAANLANYVGGIPHDPNVFPDPFQPENTIHDNNIGINIQNRLDPFDAGNNLYWYLNTFAGNATCDVDLN